MTPPIRPEVPQRPTDNPNIHATRFILKSLAEQGLNADEMMEVFRARFPELQATVEGELAAMPRTAAEDIRGGLGSALQGATFNFSDEIVGGLSPWSTIAEEREQLGEFRGAHPKTALGLELGGGLLSGLGVASGATRGGTAVARAVPRLLATGAGSGAVAGVGAGETPTGRLALGTVGAGLGAVLGAGANKIATSRLGDTAVRKTGGLRDFLNTAVGDSGGDVVAPVGRSVAEESEPRLMAALRSIQERTSSGAPELAPGTMVEQRWRALSDAGLGDVAMAADVLPGGAREVRRAANIAPQADVMVRERLGTRGAGVGPRVRGAMQSATGLDEQTTASGVEDLVRQRASRAAPVYEAARIEGEATRGLPRGPGLEAFLAEPDVQDLLGTLRTKRQYRGLADDSPEMLDALYKAISELQGNAKIRVPGATTRDNVRDLSLAKQQALGATDERMPSYRAAATEFADASQLNEAYQMGLDLFNKPVGEIRAAMTRMTPDAQDVFKRGVFDATIERRVAPTMPNPDLGDVARQSKTAGQSAINTQAAADRIRAVFGDDAYGKMVGSARGEGVLNATATEATQNSSTARQLSDMGVFGQLAQDVGSNVTPSPEWMAARMVRGAVKGGADAWARRFNQPANELAADLLTREGPENVKGLLDLLAKVRTDDAARKATTAPLVGTAVRTGVGRVGGN